MERSAVPNSFNGTVEPGAQLFVANSDQTLLIAMEQAGIHWPSSCRNGTCRTCIGQLDAGVIRYAMQWPGLSAEEKAAGALLPCVAYPCAAVRLRYGLDAV